MSTDYTTIALTYDDGPTQQQIATMPNGKLTESIMKALNAKNIKATFFVVGDNLIDVKYEDIYSNTIKEKKYVIKTQINANIDNKKYDKTSNREILKKLIESGHLVGNHSMTHPWIDGNLTGVGLLKLAIEDRKTELRESQKAIYEASGKNYKPRFFRAPQLAKIESDIEAINSELGFVKCNGEYHIGIHSECDDKSYENQTSVEFIEEKYQKAFTGTGEKIFLSHDSGVNGHILDAVQKVLADVEEEVDAKGVKTGFHKYNKLYRIKFVRIDELNRKNNRLEKGEFILKGQRFFSDNRKYQLTFQDDSNFVVYDSTGKAVWNGDAEIYKTVGKYIWQMKIDKIELNNDGELRVYQGNIPTVWKKNVEKLQLDDNGKPCVTHTDRTVEYI